MSHCPSCGRYVGPYDGCPYCGARMTGRISVRLIKLIAVLLSVVGLAFLWLVARRVEVPTVSVGEVGSAMNLAYVRVEGRCARTPSFDPDTGYLSFWVADETGELLVASYRAETQALIAQGKVPSLGDRVSLAGTLRLREDFPSLTVNLPDDVEIGREDPEALPIGDICVDRALQRVLVTGQVRGVTQPYPGLTLITLRDGTGVVDVAVSEDLVALSGVTPMLSVGQVVEVAAAVSAYRGRPQLVPASTADIAPLDQELPIASPSLVMELSEAEAGRWVAVRGTITELVPFSRGLKVGLDDGSGTITVLLWQDVYDALADELEDVPELRMGAEIEAQGTLADYAGELEVIPELARDVRVLTSLSFTSIHDPEPPLTPTKKRTGTPQAPGIPSLSSSPTKVTAPTAALTPTPRATATPAIVVTSMGSISTENIGEVLTVEGIVVGVMSFPKGFSFNLDDGDGEIVLLMWHDVYDDCWDREKVNLGATVRATGELSLYEGALQIEPRFGGDVKVTGSTTGAAAQREISSLSADDEGHRVLIEGEVARTEGLTTAVKVFLRGEESADQGEIVIFIWRNVLDRIVDNVGLGTPGSRVRVVGRVQVYRSNLEIVPLLPHDVTVLEIP